MRLVWNAPILQKRHDEEPTCPSIGIYPCSLLAESGRNNTETSFIPSQTVTNTTGKKDLPSQTITNTTGKKDSIYTLTVEIPRMLPSGLVMDTSLLPSSFAFATALSRASSSHATHTALLGLAVFAAPVAMLLPQINP